jgi:hypothetical protein
MEHLYHNIVLPHVGKQNLAWSSTSVPPYPQVIRSKTYHGYVKPWIMLNTIYNMIFV